MDIQGHIAARAPRAYPDPAARGRGAGVDYDAIILGAGGAGLMCAGIAGQRGRRVVVIDHNDQPGAKILISGGGRCNFTNLHTAPDRYLSANPHFARSALSRYTAQDFVALVDRHHIAWHEKTLGQLFCDGSARQIVKLLLDECPADSVTLRLGAPIRSVTHADGRFTVTTDSGTFAPRRNWSSPPAARRSPNSARPACPTISPDSSG